ncbi:MAG TPA: phosphate ABC transporter ATP-binding protein [Anaerolineae bacterium]|nr:phosphate ABC transporter ATP-binding protein [Anaerolineae bacterium]
MNDVVYELQQVTKAYGSRVVLKVEGLEVRRGEILGLVGPSGAGKSTLLRLLNFLESPSSGTVRFLDRAYGPGQGVPIAERRRVTMVFQRPLLLNRSVWANVLYGLRLRGERRTETRALVQSTLEKVGLGGISNQRARTLSGGEAQRVALARAMILRPDVLLLDEPTANLDPYNVGLIEDIVRTLNREQGTTMVMVTHNVFQARRLAHRVALMLEGQIAEEGDVQGFFESPRDPRTAAFVRGEMVY